MTKAEEKAYHLYPGKPGDYIYDGGTPYLNDANENNRSCYIQGYNQARKDTIEEVIDWMKMKCWVRHDENSPNKCIINLTKFKEDMNYE